MFRPVFFLLFLCFAFRVGAAEIRPPFGLDWGMGEDRLEKMLSGAKARIVARETLDDGRHCWTVEGLVQTHLKRTLFYFRNDGLAEVELQYENRDWLSSDYNGFLGRLRTQLEQRYGSGRLLERSRSPLEGSVMQTVVGYLWGGDSPTQIKLIYFAAETPGQVYRTVSLHYKAVY